MMDFGSAGTAEAPTFIWTSPRHWTWAYAAGQSDLWEGKANKTRYSILLSNELEAAYKTVPDELGISMERMLAGALQLFME